MLAAAALERMSGRFDRGFFGLVLQNMVGQRDFKNGRDDELVFQKCYLTAGDIETLLFGLSKMGAVIDGEFRVVDEGVVEVIFCCTGLCNSGSVLHEIEHEALTRLFDLPLVFFGPSSLSSPSLSLVSRLIGGGVGLR